MISFILAISPIAIVLVGIMHFVVFAGVSGGLVMFALSNFVGPEITSLGTGVIGVLLCILFVRFVPINTPREYRYKSEGKIKRKYSTFQALSPYIYILILIPLVRYGVPPLFPENGFATMCLFGYIGWVDAVILLCSLLGAITLGMNVMQMKKVVRQTIKSLAPVMITMGNLICPNNVVAACATVNLIGREGDVLRITFRAFFIILIEYMIISMLYTYMIFPGFGL